MSLDLRNQCRTCLKTDIKLQKLTAMIDGKAATTYKDALKTLANFLFKAEYEDEMPQRICDGCCRKLRSAQNFIIQAEEANGKLIRILKDIQQMPSLKQLDCLNENPIELSSTVEQCLQIKMEVENFESAEKDLKQIDNWIDNIAIKNEPQFDGENQLLKSVEKDAETNNQSSAQSIAQNERYKAFHVEKCLQIKMEVENFESPEKDLKQIDNWIDNIAIKNEPQFDGENQLLKSVEKDAEANYQSSAESVVQNESTHLPKELKMSCPNCGSRRCNMYADMRTFHGQEPLDVLLNNSNTTQYKLQAHVKSEHGSKTDENNEMKSNSGLVVNKEAHQKSKKIKYKCTVCEKAFKRRKKFKEHMCTHANERPYKCPHCERSFLQSRFLNIHIRTHMERRPTKSEGDQSGIESMSQERRAGGGGGDGGNRRQSSRKNRPVLDFSIKVTNLKRGMRIKDFKAELRKRQCNPLGITWKPSIGRCFLHFGNRNGQPSTDEDVEKVLNALSNLTLTINPPRNDNAPNANGAEGDVGEPSPQSKPPKIINLNVKLINRRKKSISSAFI